MDGRTEVIKLATRDKIGNVFDCVVWCAVVHTAICFLLILRSETMMK